MQHSFKTIIYLHGFQSSSRSQKANTFQTYLTQQKNDFSDIEFISPDLPFSPVSMIERISKLLDEVESPVLVGSSMGGFYATYFSQALSLPTVLINPVVQSELLFDTLLGQEIENVYTGEKHYFVQEDLDKLKEITLNGIHSPELIFNLLETGDEVLDYRLAEKKYKICTQKVFQGGDHRFQNFENCLPDIMQFYRQF